MVNQQLKNQIQPYFESLWHTTMEYGWVDVSYEGQVVLQVWNLPDGDLKQNVVLSFYPYSYNYSLVQRFKTCCYYKDFAAFDSEEDNFMQASYGKNIDKAIEVASYILQYVYQIPLSDPLVISLSKPQAKW